MENQRLQCEGFAIAPPRGDNTTELPDLVPTKTIEETAEASKSAAQLKQWRTIVKDQTIEFDGRERSITDLTHYVMGRCAIKPDITIAEVRHKEAEMSNLMSQIILEETKANYSLTALEHHKQELLTNAIKSNDKRSMSVIDISYCKEDKEYKQTKDLILNAKLSKDVLGQLYRMCANAVERLNKISMALMVELKNTRS